MCKFYSCGPSEFLDMPYPLLQEFIDYANRYTAEQEKQSKG